MNVLGTSRKRENSILYCVGFLGKLLLVKKERALVNPSIAGEKKSTDFSFSFQTAQGFECYSPLGTEHCNSTKFLGQLGRREPVYTVLGEIRKN